MPRRTGAGPQARAADRTREGQADHQVAPGDGGGATADPLRHPRRRGRRRHGRGALLHSLPDADRLKADRSMMPIDSGMHRRPRGQGPAPPAGGHAARPTDPADAARGPQPDRAIFGRPGDWRLVRARDDRCPAVPRGPPCRRHPRRNRPAPALPIDEPGADRSGSTAAASGHARMRRIRQARISPVIPSPSPPALRPSGCSGRRGALRQQPDAHLARHAKPHLPARAGAGCARARASPGPCRCRSRPGRWRTGAMRSGSGLASVPRCRESSGP